MSKKLIKKHFENKSYHKHVHNMIYFNHEHSDKEIKKIVTRKNNMDLLYFFMLCQLIQKYYVPREIVKNIFMCMYQRIKIKTSGNNYVNSNIIINTNVSHLFIDEDDEFRKFVDNQNFINVVKLGIKYIYVGTEYIVTLGLDGAIRYVNFISNEVTTLDTKIRCMKNKPRYNVTQFLIISYENILHVVDFTYDNNVKKFTYNKRESKLSFRVKKVNVATYTTIIISTDNVAYWRCDISNCKIPENNIMSVACVHLIYTHILFLTCDGFLRCTDYENNNNNIISFPIDNKIARIKEHPLGIFVISKDGLLSTWSPSHKYKIFRKLRDNVKNIYFGSDYTIFLLKNNKVKFLWT